MVSNLPDISRKIWMWVIIYKKFVNDLGIDECLNQ